jgi:hypothetical protein
MGRHRPDPRIEVKVLARADAQRQRELRAFACYCITRLERDLGPIDGWVLTVRAAIDGFECVVIATRGDHVVEARGLSRDAVLATWEAFCRVDPMLRAPRHVSC